ncbi:MAG: dTMP kinase [Rubrimonas sp.]|uniref:dTMP kinase n=1 Tax=Rubrimonas sp. TaxID=2036015 RepID=UPI002FDE0588
MSGTFVTFEGVDGAGKTTQLRKLAARLRKRGLDVVETREPGGAPGAEEIRRLLVEGAPGRWSAETETLLFTAARRDHMERTVAPALARGAVVLCDRFADSTRAYQAAGRGASRALVDALHELVIGREPDLALILDVDPEAALARGTAREAAKGGGETRFEAFGLDFQRRLRDAFRAIAAAEPQRCALIDASGAETAVAARIDAALARLPALAP